MIRDITDLASALAHGIEHDPDVKGTIIWGKPATTKFADLIQEATWIQVETVEQRKFVVVIAEDV